MDIKVKNLLHSTGLKYGLRDSEIKELFESQFKFIQERIENLKIDQLETEEQVDNLKTNFQLKYWGKLYINKDTLKRKLCKTKKF